MISRRLHIFGYIFFNKKQYNYYLTTLTESSGFLCQRSIVKEQNVKSHKLRVKLSRAPSWLRACSFLPWQVTRDCDQVRLMTSANVRQSRIKSREGQIAPFFPAVIWVEVGRNFRLVCSRLSYQLVKEARMFSCPKILQQDHDTWAYQSRHMTYDVLVHWIITLVHDPCTTLKRVFPIWHAETRRIYRFEGGLMEGCSLT